MKTSRWKRYDKNSGLWIGSSKRIYLYWFRFLQHAGNDPSRVVDWSKYEGWGGRNVICDTDTKFDEWWKKNWKTLFGYKISEVGRETEPLYSLSKAPSGKRTRPQPEGIRYALMVYELKDRPLLDGDDLTGEENESDGKGGDAWEIAKWIAKREYPKRKAKAKKDPSYKTDDWVFNTARKVIARELRKTDPTGFSKQRRTLQSRVVRYMRAAETHLDNVCKGQFP